MNWFWRDLLSDGENEFNPSRIGLGSQLGSWTSTTRCEDNFYLRRLRRRDLYALTRSCGCYKKNTLNGCLKGLMWKVLSQLARLLIVTSSWVIRIVHPLKKITKDVIHSLLICSWEFDVRDGLHASTHAVGLVSRFFSNPGREHWEAVKWIFRYLKGSSKLCVRFGGSAPTLESFTNADMAKDFDNQKSTSGYLFTFAGGAVSWQSKL